MAKEVKELKENGYHVLVGNHKPHDEKIIDIAKRLLNVEENVDIYGEGKLKGNIWWHQPNHWIGALPETLLHFYYFTKKSGLRIAKGSHINDEDYFKKYARYTNGIYPHPLRSGEFDGWWIDDKTANKFDIVEIEVDEPHFVISNVNTIRGFKNNKLHGIGWTYLPSSVVGLPEEHRKRL